MNGKGGTRESPSFSLYIPIIFSEKQLQYLHVKKIPINFAALKEKGKNEGDQHLQENTLHHRPLSNNRLSGR